MDSAGEATIRTARRGDVPALVDLRVQHLGETARAEPGVRMGADARSRSEHALPVWLGQDERIVLVAVMPGDDDGVIAGYAMGSVGVLPPILRRQRVGEILECFVGLPHRGGGLGRLLVEKLTDVLLGRGVHVLRASVPAGNETAKQRFASAGYSPVLFVMRRTVDRL
jgi:GNAT superfamily N-acetyltransferase